MDSSRLTEFHLFPRLPMELRLMIWEYTWPESRVIEATYYDDTTDDDGFELTVLRLGGSLSKFLSTDFGGRILQDGPLERSPPPVSLRVCRESRRHTLKEFIEMRHAKYDAGSFFFSPSHDVLWFSQDFTDEISNLREIEEYYGNQLHNVKNIMVEEVEWHEMTPARYTSDYLSPFVNIRNLFIYYGAMDYEAFNWTNGVFYIPDFADIIGLSNWYSSEYARLAREANQGIEPSRRVRFITSQTLLTHNTKPKKWGLEKWKKLKLADTVGGLEYIASMGHK